VRLESWSVAQKKSVARGGDHSASAPQESKEEGIVGWKSIPIKRDRACGGVPEEGNAECARDPMDKLCAEDDASRGLGVTNTSARKRLSQGITHNPIIERSSECTLLSGHFRKLRRAQPAEGAFRGS